MKNTTHSMIWIPGMLTALCGLSMAACGGGGGAVVMPAAITVAVAPSSPSVQAGATQSFMATVHGTNNTSVTWSITQGGTACTPGCGTLSSAKSNPVTYTGPTNPPVSSLTVTITATSAADASKSASGNITVPAASVSLPLPAASVVVNASQQFVATVSNTSNSAVTWTLTQAGLTCSPGCGTLNNTNTNPVVYTAPPAVPASSTVTITATSLADTTKSASAAITVTAANANNVKLNGQYAFLLNGFDANGAVGIAGSFMADGNGNIKNGGVEDINRATGVNTSVAITAGNFDVFADNRGSLVLTTSLGTSTFRFALGTTNGAGVATKMRIIEFDTSGTRISGFGELQDSTAFSVAQVSGDFAFGGSGADAFSGRFGIAGRFSVAGGNVTNGEFDANGHVGGNLGGASIYQGIAGSYTVTAPNGRGTLQLTVPIPSVGDSFTLNFSFYVVSANDLLFISTDSRTSTSEPLTCGQALGQSPSPASFSQASLNGISVENDTGVGAAGGPDVEVGLLTTDGAGSYTFSTDENNSGVIFAPSNFTGNYNVEPDGLGRVTLTGGGNPPVLYLVSQNKGFILFTDSRVETGTFEPQAPAPPGGFTNASISGNFFFGVIAPAVSAVIMNSGVLSSDGSGNCLATMDDAGPLAPLPDDFSFCSYSVQTSPNNGRVLLTLTDDFSTLTSAFVAYLVSPSKIVFLDTTRGASKAAVMVVEK